MFHTIDAKKLIGSFLVLIGLTTLTYMFLSCHTARADNTVFSMPVPRSGDFIENIAYGPNPEEVLDLCRPTGAPTQQHPGIIMIHGGGWVHGDKKFMDNWCQRLAQLGFVVTDINYRLASKQDITPGWPGFQIGDVQLAIRWMRFHAKELNFNPDRLCAYGTSAGGYLAVFAGTLHTIEPSDVAALAPTVPVSLSCIADGFGPVDLTDTSFVKHQFDRLIGTPYSESPDIYKNDSPLFHVNAQTPPTLVIHGTKDDLVPIEQSEKLITTLKQNNVAVQFVTYDGGHGYTKASPMELDDVFNRMVQFFKIQMGT